MVELYKQETLDLCLCVKTAESAQHCSLFAARSLRHVILQAGYPRPPLPTGPGPGRQEERPKLVSSSSAWPDKETCASPLSLSLSLSGSFGGSVVEHALASEWTWARSRLQPTTELTTNQPLSQSLRGNLEPDRETEITAHSDLRGPCPGIICLAGRTAGKNLSGQSEAARCTLGAITGPRARSRTGRPDSRGVQARSLSLSLGAVPGGVAQLRRPG